MSEELWAPALQESELQEGSMGLAFPRGISVILIKKGTNVYALRNRCAHMSCTLASGRLDGYILTCPCHEWRFDIRSGEFADAPELRVPTYDWKSEDGTIYVKLKE